MSDQAMRAAGVLTARVILGLIFGMAGYWKTFELTPIGHAQKLFIGPYADTWIPVWMLWATGTIIPVVELAAGWMLVIGWRVRECLVALGVILVTVTYGHLLLEPLFNFNGHVIPRTLLLLVVAFTPRNADWCSLDGWLERRTTHIEAVPKSDGRDRMVNRVMPEFPFDDVPAAVRHYREVLGFSVNYEQRDIGVMDRDDVRVLLVLRTPRHTGIGSAYFYVRDADRLYAELLRSGADVQGEPVSQPWGLREFSIADLERNRLTFGQPFE